MLGWRSRWRDVDNDISFLLWKLTIRRVVFEDNLEVYTILAAQPVSPLEAKSERSSWGHGMAHVGGSMGWSTSSTRHTYHLPFRTSNHRERYIFSSLFNMILLIVLWRTILLSHLDEYLNMVSYLVDRISKTETKTRSAIIVLRILIWHEEGRPEWIYIWFRQCFFTLVDDRSEGVRLTFRDEIQHQYDVWYRRFSSPSTSLFSYIDRPLWNTKPNMNPRNRQHPSPSSVYKCIPWSSRCRVRP